MGVPFTPEPPETGTPSENGQRLATFPRGPGAELRVNLSEFEGRPFVSLRIWEQGQDGAWWPVKGKGCSVRLAEASGLIDALQAAIGAAGELDRQKRPVREGEPSEAGRGRPQRPDFREANLPRLAGGEPGFDEFKG